MKTRLVILAALIGALASCQLSSPPEWDGTPNPLDTPQGDLIEPLADHGAFGPNWEMRRYFGG